jgi:hypothetical protein
MEIMHQAARSLGKARKYRHARTIAEIVGAVLLLSGGAATAGTFHAATSGSSGVIRGCANTRTGALSVLAKGRTACPGGTRALSWNSALFGTKTGRAARATGGGDYCTIGQIILTAGKTSGPDTMPARGQSLSISKNTALFSLLGTDYGGNGTSTFRLPDLRNAAPNGLTYSICVTGTFP